jgi:hypothetical protein
MQHQINGFIHVELILENGLAKKIEIKMTKEFYLLPHEESSNCLPHQEG